LRNPTTPERGVVPGTDIPAGWGVAPARAHRERRWVRGHGRPTQVDSRGDRRRRPSRARSSSRCPTCDDPGQGPTHLVVPIARLVTAWSCLPAFRIERGRGVVRATPWHERAAGTRRGCSRRISGFMGSTVPKLLAHLARSHLFFQSGARSVPARPGQRSAALKGAGRSLRVRALCRLRGHPEA
jgi:hypothetical protein